MPRKPLATRTAGPVGRDDVLAELRRVVDERSARTTMPEFCATDFSIPINCARH